MDHVASPPPARPASTVIIARDAGSEIEVLLAKRAATLRFMANAHVFPGGALHEGDRADALAPRTRRIPQAWPDGLDPVVDRALAWTALRETLEEVGVLLGADQQVDPTHIGELRRGLHAGEPLAVMLERLDLTLDLGVLVPLIRWITPRSEPVRFDTRFYVAPAPVVQALHPDGTETSDAIWCSPRVAIAEHDRGSMILSPPTRRTLLEITDVPTVAQLLERARCNAPFTVEPILRIEANGDRLILFPGDPDHPVRERLLRGPTRAVW